MVSERLVGQVRQGCRARENCCMEWNCEVRGSLGRKEFSEEEFWECERFGWVWSKFWSMLARMAWCQAGAPHAWTYSFWAAWMVWISVWER